MIATPQMEPISTLVRDHKSVFAKLSNGPVWLASRSRPTAVLIAVAEWDKIANELSRLQRLEEGDRQLAEIRAGDYEEFDISQAPA